MKLRNTVLWAIFLVLGSFSSAFAETALNSGDTAWMIVSTALVMMMTPAGLALFYGGMSRYKNLLNTTAMTFMSYCIASILWVVVGYTLAFGPDKGGIIGGLESYVHGWHHGQQPFRNHSHVCVCTVSNDVCRHNGCAGSGVHCRTA